MHGAVRDCCELAVSSGTVCFTVQYYSLSKIRPPVSSTCMRFLNDWFSSRFLESRKEGTAVTVVKMHVSFHEPISIPYSEEFLVGGSL